jgi:hypothetical protein
MIVLKREQIISGIDALSDSFFIAKKDRFDK